MTDRDDSVWQPPSSNLGGEKAGSPVARFFAVSGILLAFAPVPVWIYVLTSVATTFEGVADFGTGDPELMAGQISERLVPAVLASFAGYFGFLGAILAAGFGRYHPAWLFWSLVVLSVLYLISIPIGTVLAIACGAVLVIKRREFGFGASDGSTS